MSRSLLFSCCCHSFFYQQRLARLHRFPTSCSSESSPECLVSIKLYDTEKCWVCIHGDEGLGPVRYHQLQFITLTQLHYAWETLTQRIQIWCEMSEKGQKNWHISSKNTRSSFSTSWFTCSHESGEVAEVKNWRNVCSCCEQLSSAHTKKVETACRVLSISISFV